jgi:hypothetical protein
MALDLIVNRGTERITRNVDRSVVIYNPFNAIIQLLDSFAIKIAVLGIKERFTTQIYHFRMFVFVSLYCVALYYSAPMANVEKIIKKCISDSTLKYSA